MVANVYSAARLQIKITEPAHTTHKPCTRDSRCTSSTRLVAEPWKPCMCPHHAQRSACVSLPVSTALHHRQFDFVWRGAWTSKASFTLILYTHLLCVWIRSANNYSAACQQIHIREPAHTYTRTSYSLAPLAPGHWRCLETHSCAFTVHCACACICCSFNTECTKGQIRKEQQKDNEKQCILKFSFVHG